MIIGILAIWLGLCAIVTATLSYTLAMQASRAPRKARSTRSSTRTTGTLPDDAGGRCTRSTRPAKMKPALRVSWVRLRGAGPDVWANEL